ncbi:MAG: hypothetical protein ISR84_04590 [Kiritimatiellales bacterium]|nr:hypothetical protein [Kiritimatiellales bacterium]
MRKRILFFTASAVLLGGAVRAAIRDEWSFKDDAPRTTLNGAINSGSDQSSFEPGGTGVLEADGEGLLQSAPAGGGLWDGVELDAGIAEQSVLYLRYDLDYDLSSPYYTNGSALGVSFIDGSSGELAGLMFVFEPEYTAAAPAGSVLTPVDLELQSAGVISAIAKVDVPAGQMTVWYRTDPTAEFVESEPAATHSISLSSISDLRVQASGDALPAGTDDYIAVENIRTADTWEEITTIVDVGPILSDRALTIRVAPGDTASGSVELFNTGRENIPFTVSDDGTRPAGYSYESQTATPYPFGLASVYPDTVFEWQNGESVLMELGFDFQLFGNVYERFSVDRFGRLVLLSDQGLEAAVVPFETSAALDPASVRYRKESARLVVAWGHETGQEFQAWLHADGTIEYFYELGAWDGFIGLVDEQGERVAFDHVPGQILADSLLIEPEPWIVYQPAAGALSGLESRSLIFTASPDATISTGTRQFSVFVDWEGEVEEVEVTVIVEPRQLQLVVPATFAFSGPAGSISPDAVMSVTNSGNASLTYTLFNSGLRDAGYDLIDGLYSWTHIPETPQYELDAEQLGSEPVSIGFPFVFFGNVFTDLVVQVDGTMTFGNGESIVPFSDDLQLGLNSSVRAFSSADATRFVVTWDYLLKPGGTDDQRFQAILYRDGRIVFNYNRLDEGWQNGEIELRGASRIPGSLVNDETTSVFEQDVYGTVSVTNWVGGTPFVDEELVVVGTETVTNYISPIIQQVIEYTPAAPSYITYSPVSATLLAGATADMVLKGDARTLAAGDTIDTTLIFNYDGGAATNETSFSVTPLASVDAVVVRAAMWGAEEAGVSSTMNADGSRSLSWPAPSDSLSRRYQVWYTLSLTDSWIPLASVENTTTFVDNTHNDQPVIFYKVTVQ